VKQLRLAVIGAGHLGRIHARLAQQHESAELVAVVDPSEPARDQIRESCSVATFSDYQEILGSIDAAVIASPTPLHHRIAKDLLSSGIHCLVEKPITVTLDEANDLIATAEENSTVLGVGHVERFNPAYASAVPYVTRPKYIEAERSGPYTCRSTDVSIVLDLMIHDLDLVLSLVRSPVKQVDAMGAAVFGPHEDIAQARVTFENGCIADIKASRASFKPAREMHIYSERGYANIDFATRTTRTIRPCSQLMQRQIDVDSLSPAEKNDIKENLFTKYLPLEEFPAAEANPLLDEQADFLDAIRTGRQPRVSGPEAKNALSAALAVLESISEHRWDGAHHGLRGPHFAVGRPTLSVTPIESEELPLRRKAG